MLLDCSPDWVTQPPMTCSTVAGVDAGLLDERPLSGAEQLGGVQAGQPSVALADGAAGGFDDDRVTHSVRLEHVS